MRLSRKLAIILGGTAGVFGIIDLIHELRDDSTSGTKGLRSGSADVDFTPIDGGKGSGARKTTVTRVNSIDERLSHIARLAQQYTYEVYGWTRKQLHDAKVPSRDTIREVKTLYKKIREAVDYRSDPVTTDTFANPMLTLQWGGGDCDDFSVLSAAALAGLGYPVRFKVIRTKGAKSFDHIYPIVDLSKGFGDPAWVAFDASLDDRVARVGWELPPRLIDRASLYNLNGTRV